MLPGRLIGHVGCCRYGLIVLHADDNGQGGTFALFSILKRQAELGKRSQVRAPLLLGLLERPARMVALAQHYQGVMPTTC